MPCQQQPATLTMYNPKSLNMDGGFLIILYVLTEI